jgi:hypothetical protein
MSNLRLDPDPPPRGITVVEDHQTLLPRYAPKYAPHYREAPPDEAPPDHGRLVIVVRSPTATTTFIITGVFLGLCVLCAYSFPYCTIPFFLFFAVSFAFCLTELGKTTISLTDNELVILRRTPLGSDKQTIDASQIAGLHFERGQSGTEESSLAAILRNSPKPRLLIKHGSAEQIPFIQRRLTERLRLD